MKDPNDKKTVDGFADLITQLDTQPPAARVGRPPKGDKAQSPAEKQKAYRDRKREEKAAAKAAKERGDRPTSSIIDLTTDFVSLISRKQS
jgi:hypothetical protein